jgi:hypothetical protein
MAEVAEITISQAHLGTLRGASPREFLQGFLAAHEENLEIPTRIIWMMKRTLVGALLYHHSGEGATALLASMPEPARSRELHGGEPYCFGRRNPFFSFTGIRRCCTASSGTIAAVRPFDIE